MANIASSQTLNQNGAAQNAAHASAANHYTLATAAHLKSQAKWELSANTLLGKRRYQENWQRFAPSTDLAVEMRQTQLQRNDALATAVCQTHCINASLHHELIQMMQGN
jgi:hypothetical protein